jgi:hypothetical protein
LREALEDSAENPRFIETLPKRGYRFIVPLVAGELLFRQPSGHVTLLHSVAGLARIALVVADFKGIRAAWHFR